MCFQFLPKYCQWWSRCNASVILKILPSPNLSLSLSYLPTRWRFEALSAIRGVARILHWGLTEAEHRTRENRGAESAEGGDWGGDVPLSNRLGGLGESWAPQRGPERTPGRQRILGTFEAPRILLVERTVPTKLVFFRKKSTLTLATMSAMTPCCPKIKMMEIHLCYNLTVVLYLLADRNL